MLGSVVTHSGPTKTAQAALVEGKGVPEDTDGVVGLDERKGRVRDDAHGADCVPVGEEGAMCEWGVRVARREKGGGRRARTIRR